MDRTDRAPAVMLAADALAPIAGALVTLFVAVPQAALGPYLGFFAGVLSVFGDESEVEEDGSEEDSAFDSERESVR